MSLYSQDASPGRRGLFIWTPLTPICAAKRSLSSVRSWNWPIATRMPSVLIFGFPSWKKLCRSALDRTRGEALHHEALGDEVEDHQRQRRERRAGHQRPPREHVAGDEIVECERRGAHRFRGGEDECQQ